ncbi:MAG TPA: DNA repair protein RecN [Steroidobacteraceae bacterium]|nr:DNA repair protein RecN [Steroidobacteraceae bacterium]
MLRHLQVRDFAIIDAVEIEFQPGMTVLSGETGAGKSILIDALELLAGGRAGADVVRAGAEKAEISATLDISGGGGRLRQILQDQSIAEEGELVLRRSIGSDGRSRAWINGQSVPVQLLRQVTELLFDIHGQHEFQSLVKPATQRDLLDGYGALEAAAGKVRAAHATWLALLNATLQLESAAGDRHARLDLLRHQLQELDALQLRIGEVAELQLEHGLLGQSGKLAENLRAALDLLYEGEPNSAHTLIARAQVALRVAGEIDPRLKDQLGLLEEASVSLKEAAHALSGYLNSQDADPARQDAVERRLAAIEELARKHRVDALQLPDRHGEIAREVAQLGNAAEDLGTLRKQLSASLTAYQDLAAELSTRRKAAALILAAEITGRMQELGMKGGVFDIAVEPLEASEPAPHGIDKVEFRVSANPGQPARALSKVASGGELSRLSLAVQVSCAQQASSLLVFDEVDAGIGGAVAEIVGRELRRLAGTTQVLCVTHLPQVAAQAHQQLRVQKQNDGRSTRTQVVALDPAARIDELARMLGGVDVSDRARAHAVEMIEKALQPPPKPAPAPTPAPAAAAAKKRGRQPA